LFRAGRSLPPISLRRGLGWIALAVLVFVFPFVYRPFSIPSAGMEGTILHGDKVLMRMVGLSSPARGEIVAFRSPADATLITLKRIVAIGGDRVQLKQKRLFINGIERNEPYVIHIFPLVDPFRDNFPQEPSMPPPGARMGRSPSEEHCGWCTRRSVGQALRAGGQPGQFLRQPLHRLHRGKGHCRKTGNRLIFRGCFR
jgi:signal peptidase I